MRANRPPTRVLRFRVREFDDQVRLRNLDLRTEVDKAKFLGVTNAHYHRVANGKTRPGAGFVGAVLKALPGVSFEYLFEVEEIER